MKNIVSQYLTVINERFQVTGKIIKFVYPGFSLFIQILGLLN